MKNVIVIKVGTSSLLDSEEQPFRTFEYVAESIKLLREQGNEVVLVTSGAIGFGVQHLALDARPDRVNRLQALSMIGQVGLLHRWRDAFRDITIGQVLVTRRELHDDVARNAFRESIVSLYDYGALPIVNENDAVSNEEISFGDNDQLAAEVAAVLGAHTLVLLTDQDGIQSGFDTPEQTRLAEVSIADVQRHVSVSRSTLGSGGMASKLVAARIGIDAGATVYIGKGAARGSIENVLSGRTGTKLVE